MGWMWNFNSIIKKNSSVALNINFLQIQNCRIVKPRALTLRAVGYKMKTRKSASKRFKVTGTGKVIRRQCGKQHLNEKKSRNKKNSLSTYKLVAESDMTNVIKCLPYKSK